MKKFFSNTIYLLLTLSIFQFSCKEIPLSKENQHELCFDTSIYKQVYTNKKLVILERKTTRKEESYSPLLSPIDKTTAALIVSNYHSNVPIIKSTYVDFPIDADNITKVLNASGDGGTFRIYFGAYERTSADKKFPNNPIAANNIINHQTVLLVPVTSRNSEDLRNIVNLGNLCPPEACSIDSNGNYKSGTLANEAKLPKP